MKQDFSDLVKTIKWPTDRNVLVLDVGNSDLKGYVNGERFSVPTSYTTNLGLKPRELRQQRAPFDGFAVYDYKDSAKRQYKFGRGQETGKMPANSDKGTFYKTIVQGCCGGVDNSLPWTVIVSHWDEYRDEELAGSLQGIHTVCVNGNDKEINIDKVVFVVEGEGANLLYRQNGGGQLAIIDVGYDTVGLRVCNDRGEVNHAYLPGYGVRRGVASIRQSPQLAERVYKEPSARAVIYALQENGQLRSNSNESENPYINISDLVRSSVEDWVADVFGELDSTYGEMINQASAYWMVGGGANWVRPYVEGQSIFIPEEPEFANATGMLLKV